MPFRNTKSDKEIKKRYSPQEAYVRITRYCAYQERSHLEVRRKLYTYGLFAAEVDELLARLVTDGFLNEERFAKAFAGGKFRMQKWGRLKITRGLETHGLSKRCIRSGLEEIDRAAYVKTLTTLLKRKLATTGETNEFKLKHKAAAYAIGRGFEPELVWATITELTD